MLFDADGPLWRLGLSRALSWPLAAVFLSIVMLSLTAGWVARRRVAVAPTRDEGPASAEKTGPLDQVVVDGGDDGGQVGMMMMYAQAPTEQLPLDDARLDFRETAYPPATGPADFPRRRSYTKTVSGIDVQGEIVVAEGWKRHTRVYGGGVCEACEESERRMRELPTRQAA